LDIYKGERWRRLSSVGVYVLACSVDLLAFSSGVEGVLVARASGRGGNEGEGGVWRTREAVKR